MHRHNSGTPVVAVAIESESEMARSRQLADRLCMPLLPLKQWPPAPDPRIFLVYRNGCLNLLDRALRKKGGLRVGIEPRAGEQYSWPAPKTGLLARAIGKKNRTVVDATAGWAQDALALFRMGYEVICIERSQVMAELIRDGLERLARKDWVRRRMLAVPELIVGDAIEALENLPFRPDCIYLDPMFPAKRKKSALARKPMAVLHTILGEDSDRDALFKAAVQKAARRVVVKSPDYAEPLGGPPDLAVQGKLQRYDVYLKK